MATPIATNIGGILTSTPMKWALGGWSFFIFENVLLSENRTKLISVLGDDAYHIAYGTLSTAAMTSVFYGYFKKVKDAPPVLWKIGTPAPLLAKLGGFFFLSVGIGMASQIPPKLQIPIQYQSGENERDVHAEIVPSKETANQNEVRVGWKVRCPFDFTDRKGAESNDDIRGLERITRHPGLWSFGLMGLGNAFLVPSIPQSIWFSMPLMVALVGGAHTDSRHRRGMGGELANAYDELTSNVPFLAMATGKQGDVLGAFRRFSEEVKPMNAAIAAGLAAIFVVRRGKGMTTKMPLR